MPRLPPAALAFVLLAGLAAQAAAVPPGELRVAAVQLSLAPGDLASAAAYVARIQGAVRRCLPFAPDLILFPEYTSAFLALLPYGGLLREAGSLDEALRRVLEREPLARDLEDLFLLNSGLAERAVRELFGGLARRYGVAVGAGTWFAAAPSGGRASLVNRAVIFDERGAQLYAQDKVFLTPFEQRFLGLRPGRIEEARPFLLKGRRIALTICRDTFFEDWEGRFGGAELWVDLKANGEPFTDQVREGFQLALSDRLRDARIPYGLSLYLTGGLAGLSWEGESFLAAWDPDLGVRILARAASHEGEEILFFTLPAADR